MDHSKCQSLTLLSAPVVTIAGAVGCHSACSTLSRFCLKDATGSSADAPACEELFPVDMKHTDPSKEPLSSQRPDGAHETARHSSRCGCATHISAADDPRSLLGFECCWCQADEAKVAPRRSQSDTLPS